LPKLLQKLAQNKQKLRMVAFVQIQDMNFSRSLEKNSEKKCASIFSTVGSKESKRQTAETVGLRQPDFSSFSGQIVRNVIFLLNFDKKLKKNKKNAKILKFFLLLFELFCTFKTLTIDLVHFYAIISTKNV
jgi:hypothetical protein